MKITIFLVSVFVINAGYCTELLLLKSPNNKLTLTFNVVDGVPKYKLVKGATKIIEPSRLGFQFKQQAAMKGDFSILCVRYCSTVQVQVGLDALMRLTSWYILVYCKYV